jgi:hypothetical protein
MAEKPLISTGQVVGINIAPAANAAMQAIEVAHAVASRGLEGDRYFLGKGRFQKGELGKRQVTLMNIRFFLGTTFDPAQSRRNIITEGVELLWLTKKGGKEFQIGDAVFKGIEYLDPCPAPGKGFKEAFSDCGAIIAEVVRSGTFRVGDKVFHENRGY